MYAIYQFNDLDYGKVKKPFDTVVTQLQMGDFKAAEVKKLPETRYYRAKLNYEDRLLFQIKKYQGQTCILLLEVIYNHNYDKSRFLRGAKIDEMKLLPVTTPTAIPDNEVEVLTYLNEQAKHFHYLDKIISFDADQQAVFSLSTPQIIIGSAGSGKTVLTLEKLKTFTGKVLYITLSPYLAENAAQLFYANNFEKPDLEVDFLSFREFIEAAHMPAGRELDFRIFETWFDRYKQATKLKEAHKTFEEFRGVLTGMDINKEYLSWEAYLSLGVKQSIFLQEEKEQVFKLFQKYLHFLGENNYYDLNIISHQWKKYVSPQYDGVVIDEVQDITNIQLFLILQSLKNKHNFILCGDANQVVHPNFFSWSHIKTQFYQNAIPGDIIRILHTNFRNSIKVSAAANLILKIKNVRFGSIDKESNYLVKTVSEQPGEIVLLPSQSKTVEELNRKTARSAGFAVLVMRNDDKVQAKKIFSTPLLFSVQESKGLEYENIILFNLVSGNNKEFAVITEGVNNAALDLDELKYNRAKEKTDKALDTYKFYINSLYVALTRAVQNIYIIEANTNVPLFDLMNLKVESTILPVKESVSSAEDWQKEARRLEKQGKTEQAEAIRRDLLKQQPVPWEPITAAIFDQLKKEALAENNFNKKAKDRLFDFALIHNQVNIFKKLADLKYRRADQYENERSSLFRKYYQIYKDDNTKALMVNLNKYGLNYRDIFNMTPLHTAAFCGSVKITELLLQNGANPEVYETFGKTPLQIALGQAFLSKEFAQHKLAKLYLLLVPVAIKIKVNDQLLKLHNSHIEFLLLNLFIAVQSSILQNKEYYEGFGIKLNDIHEALSYFPNNVLYPYRKKREYLNAALSRNEINSKAPNSRAIFVRQVRGHYLLNEKIQILQNEDWCFLTDIIKPQLVLKEEIFADSFSRQQIELEKQKKEREKFMERMNRRRENDFRS